MKTTLTKWLLVGIAFATALVLAIIWHQTDTDHQESIQTTVSERIPEAELTSLSIEELFQRGEFYFNHTDDPDGQYDLVVARQYYEAVIDRDPKGHPAVWYQLGRIDFIEGKFNTAIYRFEKQREHFPEAGINPDYMIGLTYGYKARRSGDPADWEAGATAFERFIEFEPVAPWPRVDLAWIYFAQGKYEEMKPTLVEGLEYASDNAWLLNMYGLALLNTDDPVGALEQFTKAKQSADTLTVEDWGRSYPGNNPADWSQGLTEFKAAIDKNLVLAEAAQ